MKWIHLLLLCALSSFHAQAQRKFEQEINKELVSQTSWLTLNTGLNALGIIGIEYEQRFNAKHTFFFGAGLGTWGYKLAGGIQFYRNYPLKSAFGISLSMATGGLLEGVESSVTNPTGAVVDTTINFTLRPCAQVNLTWSYNWKIGHRNRLYLKTGWSFRTSRRSKYTINTPGYTSSDVSDYVFRVLEPNGPILALAFSFGM